jgi:hypothetical protein
MREQGHTVPSGMKAASELPKERSRVLKTHLSFDMMPSQIMEKKNKVKSTFALK